MNPDINSETIIFHLVTESSFRSNISNDEYIPDSIAKEGFIHCTSGAKTVIAVAEDYFAGTEEPLLVIAIEIPKVSAKIKFEPAAPLEGSGTQHLKMATHFPHIYGALNLSAVNGVGIVNSQPESFTWPKTFVPLEQFPGIGGVKKPYRNSFSGKGVFPPKYAFTLLIPLRNIFLSPKKLIRRLELKQDHRVLEIGPGPGYFSSHIARQIPRGRLVLLDIQQEMLDISRKRLEKRNIKNVDYVKTDGNRLDLESESFDRVFMVTVIGEVDHKEDYLKEIHRILKGGGILSISESAGDPDKLSLDEIQTLIPPHGFEVETVFGNRYNYTINFRKIRKTTS